MLETVLWFITIPASIVFVCMAVATFIGADHGDHGFDHDTSHGEFDSGFKMLTFRNFVVFFTMFGWTGLAMVRTTENRFLIFIVALLVALVMMAAVSALFLFFQRMVHSGNIDIASAVGKNGVTYLTVPGNKAGFGKVVVEINSQKVEYKASTEGDTIKTGEPVKILSCQDQYVIVARG